MKFSIALLLLASSVEAFVPNHAPTSMTQPNTILPMALSSDQQESSSSNVVRRRNFLAGLGGFVTGAAFLQQSALAIPMVSVDEFDIIMRDSPMSIKIVEFSGPRGETIVARLVDGTSFGIKDVVESATDPRSPLKVSASCRESGVRTKFVDLEALLSKSTTTKKKMYTNERVQIAAEKEREKAERMANDEEDRLAALRRMEKVD